MSGRHTQPIPVRPELPPIDPHGYIRLFTIICAIAVMVVLIAAIAVRVGANT